MSMRFSSDAKRGVCSQKLNRAHLWNEILPRDVEAFERELIAPPHHGIWIVAKKLGKFLDRNKIFKITHFFAKVILKQGPLFRREIEDSVYTCLLMPHFAVGATYVPTVRRCVLCRIKNAVLEIGNHIGCLYGISSGLLARVFTWNETALKEIQSCCLADMRDLIELVFAHCAGKSAFYLLIVFELRLHAKSTFFMYSVIGRWSCRIMFLARFRSPQILPKIHFCLQNGAKTGNLSNSLKCKVFR